jgi:hypothetical protein
MAQTGYTPIQLYYSSTTTNAPTAGNLANGELAINITDGKLFYKDNANAVQVIGWKTTPTSAGGTGLTSYTAGDTLYYASGTALSKLAIGTTDYVMTSSGTAPQWSQFLKATVGGTGQTSYAVGDLLYADTTTTLAKLADVATGNALISGGVSTAPSWGKIGLTTHVSGTLPVANGGTGVTSSTGTGNVVLSNSPTLLSPQITTTTTASGAVISTLNGTGSNSTVNSTTYTVTFAYSAKVFWVALGSGDGCLVVANYKSTTITLVGTPGPIVASSTPAAGEFGIYKSADNHAISFKTGSAATSAYGSWQIMCLSSTAA